MLLLFSIYGLVFTSTALIAWQFCPIGAKVFGGYQEKRVRRDVSKLDKMFLEVPKKKMVFFYAISPLVMGLAGLILTKSLMLTLVAALFGLVLPTFVVKLIEKGGLLNFASS